MKRTTLFLILSFACGIANAQTQQGIVKTRGRLVDGQIVAGTRLSGATITLNFGNPLVSDGQGAFSFAVPTAKSYSLVNATKQGYTLADPEFTRRSFTYSATNPFYVVLEDENQRQADINAATRKIRKNLLARLDKLEEEIETLKAQNKLTEEEYQERLKQLYDNQSSSEKLIKDMAERYATTDYDQLDEFNRQVQMYIEEGELQKADSMICSKGNMEQRVAEYRNTVAANKKVREELEQSESGAAKTYEDLSQDLYRRHEIFLQKFQQDSALYCLKTRADLDTTNWDAVWDYADLCFNQKWFTESEKYFQICLKLSILNNDTTNIAKTQHGLGTLFGDLSDYTNSEKYYKLALENYEQLYKQEPNVYLTNLANTQNGLGTLYYALHDFGSCERFFKLALDNKEQLFEQNPNKYRATLAMTQTNLGNLYRVIQDFANSEKYFKLALENAYELVKQNPDANRKILANTGNGIGNLYRVLHDYASSEKYYKLALENCEQLFEQNPDAYRELVAKTQGNLGNIYSDILDYVNSEKYYKSALGNFEQLFKKNPEAYRGHLAIAQDNLGNLYNDIHEYAESEKYFKLALENREQLFRQNPNAYRVSLAMTQNNLGILYSHIHDFANSEKYFKLTLENYEQLFEQNPNVYRLYLAMTQNNLGALYFDNHDYANSEKYFKLGLENYEQLFKQNPNVYRKSFAKTRKNLASVYTKENKYEEAIEMINEAIAIMPDYANFYDSKGEILLMQGKNEEALEMWKKVLELSPDFLNNYPDGTNLSNGLKKLGLIE